MQDHAERYNQLNRYLTERFGERVYKVSLDGGFACPGRCIYCNPASILPIAKAGSDIREQMRLGTEYVRKRHHAKKFIAYFQHHTNTYGDIEKMRERFFAPLEDKDVVGIAISTRSDCITDETWELLSELGERTFLWLEIGLQSASDEMLRYIRRGHDVASVERALCECKRRKIMSCVHVIVGLPGEGREEVIGTAKFINRAGADGVKIHNLHVLKGTPLADEYNAGKIKLPSLDEYADLVCDMLEHLEPRILIHRVNGHSPRELTIVPEWSVNKLGTMNAVHDKLTLRGTYQGRLFAARG